MSYHMSIDKEITHIRPSIGSVRYYWSWPEKNMGLRRAVTDPNDQMFGSAISGCYNDKSAQWYNGVDWLPFDDGKSFKEFMFKIAHDVRFKVSS